MTRRIAVFVDGCFWHGCPLHYVAPVGNAGYWEAKIRRNKERDYRTTKLFESNGWMVLRVWECEVHRELKATATHIRRVIEERDARKKQEVVP